VTITVKNLLPECGKLLVGFGRALLPRIYCRESP
ncbi:MAG: hypothetical protein ACI92E_003222, partial [Oceanicoccus sp.]